MADAALKLCLPEPGRSWSGPQLASVSPCLERFSVSERVQWALDFLPGQLEPLSRHRSAEVRVVHEFAYRVRSGIGVDNGEVRSRCRIVEYIVLEDDVLIHLSGTGRPDV